MRRVQTRLRQINLNFSWHEQNKKCSGNFFDSDMMWQKYQACNFFQKLSEVEKRNFEEKRNGSTVEISPLF